VRATQAGIATGTGHDRDPTVEPHRAHVPSFVAGASGYGCETASKPDARLDPRKSGRRYDPTMQLFVLGLDAQGRSCVVEQREVASVPAMPGVAVASLFATTECPPPAPLPGHGTFDDMQMAPGLVHWMVVDLEAYSAQDAPTLATELHYNNTIELFCVLEGTVNTILGVGALDLHPGDCVAMPGVDHATRAGPEGARVLSISIGLASAN
jgi:mannose-6-phosphate isomerase-like protein (cupin superfamily)